MSDSFRFIRDYETLIVSILLDREYYSVIDIFELCCACCESDKFYIVCALDSLTRRGILNREVKDDLGFFKLLF